MRIAINATCRMHGGGALYLRRLLNSWHEQAIDQTDRVTLITKEENLPALALPKGSQFDLCIVKPTLGPPQTRVIWEQTRLPQLLDRWKPDVLFCPAGIVPFAYRGPTVVMFQNAAPFSAAVTIRSAGWRSFAGFRVLREFMIASGRHASKVLFISHTFKRDFRKVLNIPEARTAVIYLGRDSFSSSAVDSGGSNARASDGPFILSVGHLYPYKNIPALIRAYGVSRRELQARNLRLVVTGRPRTPAYGRKLEGLIHELDLQEWVILTGAVPHEQVGQMLRSCTLFVFQSLCENCPNALLEAMTLNVPIACSSASVMPEIAGAAARYFDPYDSSDIARALVELASNPQVRASLADSTRHELRRFPTWSEVGSRTREVLAQVVTP